jgi:two-component system, NarL family, sensor histidine kinase UhpB
VIFSRTQQARLSAWTTLPLFWRLLGINLVVVLGGALIGTWLTQRLVLSGTFTPISHGLLVVAALAVSSGLTMLLLRETFRPVRSLRNVIRRFNAGDHSARAKLTPLTDPDIAALVLEMNGLWDRLASDAATIRDKTDQAERLAAQVIWAQEEERRRVARELHDEAGQALTALIIGLERGLGSMPETYAPNLPVQPRQLVSDLRDLAAETLDEVRKLALELRPSALDDLGLVAALRQFLRTTEERTGLGTHLSLMGWDEDAERLPAAAETALFRITQEAVTNTIRHADASTVEVRLQRTEQNVTLEVRDDGVGLPSVEALSASQHLGLFGMRERAHLLGGDLDVRPAIPRGTLVEASIPLAPTSA